MGIRYRGSYFRHRWRVCFVSPEELELRTLYESAKVAIEKGYDYFIVIDSGTRKKESERTSTEYRSTSRGSVEADAKTYTTTKYRVTLTIQLKKGETPDNPAAYYAEETIVYLDPEKRQNNYP